MKTLAQGAINKNLISLPKVLFQCELIDVFKNALIMVMEKSQKKVMENHGESWNVVLKIVWEPCEQEKIGRDERCHLAEEKGERDI